MKALLAGSGQGLSKDDWRHTAGSSRASLQLRHQGNLVPSILGRRWQSSAPEISDRDRLPLLLPAATSDDTQ